MKHSIVMIFVSLTVSVYSQSPAATWTNPYFYYHYNTPLALPTPQINSAEKVTASNQNVFSGHDDYSMANTLGSHVVMLSTCLRELKTTRADLDQTTHRLDQTHTEVESVKNELKDVLTTVDNLKKEVIGNKAELHEMKENSQLMANVISTVENMKKEMNANAAATSIGRIPKSCDDLQKIGHVKSGLFPVMGNKTVNNVYCDFTKPTSDPGFQKMIGFFDVKTSPVYFHAQKTKSHTTVNTIVPFEILRLNVGNAMSFSGVFVAPKSGKYFFTYSGICEHNNVNARVELQVKSDTVDWTRVGQGWGQGTATTFSLQATLELAQGNQIRLMLLEGQIRDHASHFTNFVGHLLLEDIVE